MTPVSSYLRMESVYGTSVHRSVQSIFFASHPQSQDRSVSSGKLFFSNLIPVAAFQSRIVDSNRRIRLFQPLCKFQCIAALPVPSAVPMSPSRSDSDTRSSVPDMHRCHGKGCFGVLQYSHRAKFFVSCNLRIHLGIPLKSSTVSKNTADRIAASVDVFGRRIDHDICTMF